MQDITGYAYISGLEDNGRYVRDGKLYRLTDGVLYELESGDIAPVIPLSRFSEEGVDDVLAASLEEVDAEVELVDVVVEPEGEVLDLMGDPAPMTADDLLANWSAVDLSAMAQALKDRLDEFGVENDVVVSGADDEASARLNAEAIVKYASE